MGIIARIFDPTLPTSIYMAALPTPLFIVIGVVLLFLKDLRDEFFPNRLLLMNNKNVYIRWATYVILLATIISSGVFSSDQFIYANF